MVSRFVFGIFSAWNIIKVSVGIRDVQDEQIVSALAKINLPDVLETGGWIPQYRVGDASINLCDQVCVTQIPEGIEVYSNRGERWKTNLAYRAAEAMVSKLGIKQDFASSRENIPLVLAYGGSTNAAAVIKAIDRPGVKYASEGYAGDRAADRFGRALLPTR